jgi:hypothetical protein
MNEGIQTAILRHAADLLGRENDIIQEQEPIT